MKHNKNALELDSMYGMIPRQEMHQEEIDLSHALEQSASTPAAFKPVYEAYFLRVYRYCLKRIGNIEEAEDITSLVFTRALTHIASFRGGSFPAWLFRIAHNVLANHFRDQRGTIPLERVEQIGRDDDPLEKLETNEERQHIMRLVATLSEEQRNLLALKITARLSAKEIGVVIGKSEGAVRVAIHRVIQQLRATWDEEEE
jgi:RNA polymerase sigma-70 factor (ECF subfamily)